jgi:hypothetical protein
MFCNYCMTLYSIMWLIFLYDIVIIEMLMQNHNIMYTGNIIIMLMNLQNGGYGNCFMTLYKNLD